jgi:aspartate/glutamate racemase
MHIGLIGGIGVAATEFYYRGLIARHERSGTALDLTIVHADVYERCVGRGFWRGGRLRAPARRQLRQ